MHPPLRNSSEDGDTASLIRALSDCDYVTRETAATIIFGRGVSLCRDVTAKWFADEELQRLFVFRGDGQPIATVGIAVPPGPFEQIRNANGSPPLADVPPDQDAAEFELDYPNDVQLDILTTRELGSNGAIAGYLQKFGAGIQQVEYSVRDVDRITAGLRTKFGLEPIYPGTRVGANNTRVNFFLVPTLGGKKVLIELVEASEAM